MSAHADVNARSKVRISIKITATDSGCTCSWSIFNTHEQFNDTPLMSAAGKGHCSIVELLMSKGADPYLRNNVSNLIRYPTNCVECSLLQAWRTAYDIARMNGHNQVCQQLPRTGYCACTVM